MTITSNVYNYEDFIQNARQNARKYVSWKGKNINKPETVILLSKLINGEISVRDFSESLNIRGFERIDRIFFIKLTIVAQFNFDFYSYCKLVNIFVSWNSLCKKICHSFNFFKNMILHQNIGRNYPIDTPEELIYKLRLFNNLAVFIVITYFDILDSASTDLIKRRITSKQYIKIVYLVIKASDRKFEREICRQVLDTFKKVNDVKRLRFFQAIL